MRGTDRRRGSGPSRVAESENTERRSRLQWEFSGDVRFHGLRLLRILDRPHFFSERECFCIANAGPDDIRAGFLMRPIGAIILGAYIDRFGRRAGLMLTLGLMAIGTLLIAALPGYAVIGVAAPIVILISRLVQGFSARSRTGRSLRIFI